jgi:hypothetical protein
MLPGYDAVPWLLSRACAGEWDFAPQWRQILRHPAAAKRYEKVSRMFVVPDFKDRSIQVAVEVIKREARKLLEHREVKHFEVFPLRDEGFKPVPHKGCAERGCSMCAGLGVVFTPEKGAVATLIGWEAIVRVG